MWYPQEKEKPLPLAVAPLARELFSFLPGSGTRLPEKSAGRDARIVPCR